MLKKKQADLSELERVVQLASETLREVPTPLYGYASTRSYDPVSTRMVRHQSMPGIAISGMVTTSETVNHSRINTNNKDLEPQAAQHQQHVGFPSESAETHSNSRTLRMRNDAGLLMSGHLANVTLANINEFE